MRPQNALAGIALSKNGTVYLTAFWLVACAATLLMPRIFEGQVTIFPVRSAEMIVEELLHPTTQNFSQLTYLSISVFAVFCFIRLTCKHYQPADLLGPIRVGALVTVATGAIDYASNFVNLTSVLDPFRTASYALLTLMVAQSCGFRPGEFVHTFGDTHLYLNHLDQAREQLSRTPRPLPVMRLNPAVKSLFDFRYDDFTLEGYEPHPAIKAPVAV